MMVGSETWALSVEQTERFDRTEMRMVLVLDDETRCWLNHITAIIQ